MLYQQAWHEPLDGVWNEERASAAIRAIVADADAAFGTESLWPANDWDSWRTPTPLKSLYVGAAGVIWALDELRSRDHAEPRTDRSGGRGDARGVAARAGPDGGGRAALDEGVRPARARPASCSSPSRSRATPSSPTTSTSACARTSRARRRT